jgi:4-hydroxymandelate oxidase
MAEAEPTGAERSDPLAGLITVDELEPLARDVLERPAFDYFAGGADDEWTLRENRRSFDRWVLRPRYLVDVSTMSTATTVLESPTAAPLLIAPTAFHRLAHADGEVASARAAAAAGLTMCVSTSATAAFEDIADTGVHWWFQLYVHRERAISERLMRHARDAGATAIVLTIDLPYLSVRRRDVRNRMDDWFPSDVRMINIDRAAMELHPGSELFTGDDLWFDSSVTWADLAWVREASGLPVIVKGVMTAEDAVLAAEHGAAAIVVSNHGGRQLDSVAGTMDVLPEVVGAVGDRLEVLVDGGFRRGTDVVKAIALGARAVLVGRPPLWGLAIAGERGVRWVLETLRSEVELAMALVGATSAEGIVRSMVAPAVR